MPQIKVTEEMLRDQARERTMRAMHLHDGGDSSRAFDAGWEAALAMRAKEAPCPDDVERVARIIYNVFGFEGEDPWDKAIRRRKAIGAKPHETTNQLTCLEAAREVLARASTEPASSLGHSAGIPNADTGAIAREILDIAMGCMTAEKGCACCDVSAALPRIASCLFDRMHGAFMAGWLTRHARTDVPPLDAFAVYLKSLEVR